MKAAAAKADKRKKQAVPKTGAVGQRIRDYIEDKIRSSTWPPGHRIPFEHEFMAQFACSRMTVSRAIASFVDRGFLETKKKAGTFVTYPASHTALISLPDIRKVVLEAGHAHTHQVLSQTIRPSAASDFGQTRALKNTRVLDITTLHLGDGAPFALEHRIINLTLVPDAEYIDFALVPPSVWLLRHVPWSNAAHEIDVIALDEPLAAKVQRAVGTPCLRLERETWNARGSITHAVQYFPQGALTLRASYLIERKQP